MRIRTCLAATAVCLASGLATAQLTNGDFETAGVGTVFDSWTDFGNSIMNISQSTELVNNGMFSAKLFGQFTDDGMGTETQNDSGLTQTIAVSGDCTLVEATVSVGVNSADPLMPAEIGIAILGFLDAGGTRLSEVVQIVANDSTPADDMFTEFKIQGTAPDGTAEAELLLLHVQLGGGLVRGGAVYYDDASLEELPAGAGLKNPSFDQTVALPIFDGWTDVGNTINNIERLDATFGFPLTGTFAMKVFGQFSGTDNESYVSQVNPATPGNTYTASINHAQRSGDGLAPNNFGFMDVIFYDAGGAELLNDRTLTAVPGDAADTHFLKTSAALVAPAGAATVEYRVGLFQFMFDGGAVHYDDASFLENGSTELLTNTSFENGPAAGGIFGWQTIGDNNFIESIDPCDGPNHLKTFGGFTGVENGVGVFQDLVANPGATWEAGIDSLQDVADFLLGDNEAFLRLIFLDGMGMELSSSEVSVGDAFSPLATCESFMLSDVAPAGTATVRIELLLVQDAANSGGSIFMDGAFLNCTAGDCSIGMPDPSCAFADITPTGVCTPGTGDGVIDLSDFSCYLAEWAGSTAFADITATGTCVPNSGGDGVDLSDFSCYLAEWSLGCP